METPSAATTPGPCVFPRCVKGEQPSYCGHDCDVREKPYEHEYGTPADGLAANTYGIYPARDPYPSSPEVAEARDAAIERATEDVTHVKSAAKFGESEAGPGEASPIRQPDSPERPAACTCGHPLGDHQTPGAECVHSALDCGCVTFREASAANTYGIYPAHDPYPSSPEVAEARDAAIERATEDVAQMKSAAYALRECKRLPDLTEIPTIGSRQREDDERAVMARARELVFEEDGRLRDALYSLEQELRGHGRKTVPILNTTREYARELVAHVEQCWATAVTR